MIDAQETLDVANGLMAGLTVITVQLFPFALPLLVLCLAPLVLAGLALALVAAPIVIPVLLLRGILRRR
jgi:hypothetical protein